MERNERQGAEYARLDQAHRTGLLGLSDEDAAKYKAYNDAHEAGIAQQKAAHDAYIQSKVDAHHADADRTTGAAIAKEKAIEAQRRAAAEAAAKKPEPMDATSRCPEPGTLPAVASAKAPEGVDSSAAIGAILQEEKVKADSRAYLKEVLSQTSGAAKSSGKPASALDLLIPPVAGSVGVAPMSGFNPAMAIPALGNPATAAGAAGLAVMLGMDYQTQRREVELAYEGWRKGDASLLPDMVWSQLAARDMMEREMGYPFGRPDLAPAAVTQLESPFTNTSASGVWRDGYSCSRKARAIDYTGLCQGFQSLW